MRPETLFPLFAPVTTLPGIGPRLGKLVEKVTGGPHVANLLWRLPTSVIDRRFAPKIADAPAGRIATITVRIEAHVPPRNPRLPYKIRCSDDSGAMDLVFFHVVGDHIQRSLPIGGTRIVSGKVEHYGGMVQMTHPDRIAAPEEIDSFLAVEPVYPLTAGLTLKTMNKAMRAALGRLPELTEWQDAAWLAIRKWPRWREALLAAHTPDSEAALSPTTSARARLAYDELLANQLALGLVRLHNRRLAGRSLKGDGQLRRGALGSLVFALTASQTTALAEIIDDMAAETRMLRLLQGDVGSGKTVVAALAMLNAVECGTQAALMAPTEILARQHYTTIEPLAKAAGVKLALLTGREKRNARGSATDGLVSGEIAIAVGTHALFQDDIAFRDLGLVVIDEQHRFGVHERLKLTSKGKAVDVLVMTATPIPRTLMLSAYGDLDLSQLTEKPAGRQHIDTRTLPLERLEEVVDALARATAHGDRAFWVCPLVEESEAIDIAAATERHAALAVRFPGRVGLVHGRMKGPAKDTAMAKFAAGEIDILVATTVIEVGIDIPQATVMVIEHAERFGLAQLHQLRGRVGRGTRQSSCLLLYQAPLGDTAKARLRILRETDDGFRIAEEDLRLRGAGELLGTRQSGLPEFRLVDLAAHGELLSVAQDDARLIIGRDPDLASPRGEALRMLLYLFERDAVVRTVRSG